MTLAKILKVAVCTHAVSSIGAKKINKKVKVAKDRDFANIDELLDYVLLPSTTGSDQHIANIQGFMANYNEEEQEFIAKIITKELKIGMSKELNLIWDNLIIIPKAMKYNSYEKHLSKILGKKVMASLKLDGQRGTFENGKFLSYDRKEYEGLVDLYPEMEKFPKDFVYDGELQYIDKTGKMTRQEIRRKTAEILGSDLPEKKEIKFTIFEIIEADKWETEEVNEDFIFLTRRETVNTMVNEVKSPLVFAVEDFGILTINSEADLLKFIELSSKRDYEGVIINFLDKPYEFTRSMYGFKVKTCNTVDLKVIDMIEGKGDIEGMLGALVVDYNGVRVHVGSGFDKEERIKYWNEKDTDNSIIGKTIEIKTFGESKNGKNDDISLTSAVFMHLRTDK